MWAKYRMDYGRAELPSSFADVLMAVIAFADPIITRDAAGQTWSAAGQTWSDAGQAWE